MQQVRNVSFIGTGRMGKPLIFKLLEAGYQVQVYDKYKDTSDTVVAAGASWRDTPRAAAQGCDVVVTCLPLPHHVLDIMMGDEGALAGMHPGSTWIDSSTTDYHNTLHIAAAAAQQGVFSLEAPVSNLSHMGADFANVSFYVGGDKAGYDICEDMLKTMGRISFYVGEIGKGQTVKLFTNLLFYTAVVLWGEVLMLAKHLDIPLHWMWDYAKASRGNCFVTDQCTPFIFDGSYDRSCSLEITVKDTGLTVDLAEELDVLLPIGRIVEKRYRQAGETYDAHDNHLIVTKLIETDNHTDLQVPGFTAPSPYGANPDYRHPEGVIEDQYGRSKPHLPEHYLSPSYTLHPELDVAAHELMTFMAYVNYCILHESCLLGHKMGLRQNILPQVVRWSCGPSWVADHETTYQPNLAIVTRVAELGKGVEKLPVIHALLDVLATGKR